MSTVEALETRAVEALEKGKLPSGHSKALQGAARL